MKPAPTSPTFDRSALIRLLFETTFIPMLVGLVILASAVEPHHTGFWQHVLKYAGAFLIALCSARRYRDLDLRAR